MTSYALKVENLSKKYLIGGAKSPYKTFRETLTQSIQAPFHRIKKLMRGESAAAELTETLWALKDVSFTIAHGEAVAIIGNNGAGKSTLLKILSRITDPSSGQARIQGRLGSLLEVGTGFHPELTGRENIFLNGSLLGMRKKEIQKKFDEIVAFAQIEQFLDTPVKHYSSGMYVRLAFSVAAHLEPEILVIDEVLAVGDIRFQKRCLGKMQDVTQSGRTVIFVSHNIPAVRSLCQKGILLEKGKVQTIGPIEKVLEHYLSTFLETGGKQEWDEKERPGNGEISLISVTLLDTQGKLLNAVHLSKECCIEIFFEVLQEGVQAGFSLSLMSEEGTCVFSSLNNWEANYYGKPLKRGVYSARCYFYPDLFNNGRYYITLIGFGAMGGHSFKIERALSFEAIDDGVLKKDYFGGYGGMIRPKLLWETTKR